MSSDRGDGPRLVITSDDHRAIIVIVIVICVLWSIMVIGARMIWRFHQKSDFGLDDLTALFGTVTSIAQAALTLMGIRAGFGKRIALLDMGQSVQAGEYLYAASILYILAVCASKASMPLLIARLSREPQQLLCAYILLAITIIWGVGSMFGIAFTCGTPVPWLEEAANTCANLFPAWATIEAFGLLVECLILTMSIVLVRNLNMMTKFKIAVVVSFGLRILVVCPVALRLDLLRQAQSSSDAFFDSVKLAIATQLVLHYSLWAASFPCMRAFLRAFDTGLGVTTGVDTRRGSNFMLDSKGNSFAMRSLSRDQKRMSQISRVAPDAVDNEVPMKDVERGPRVGKISEEGSEGSQRAIISRTVEWKITYEDAPGRAL